jgi:hypothetical protein
LTIDKGAMKKTSQPWFWDEHNSCKPLRLLSPLCLSIKRKCLSKLTPIFFRIIFTIMSDPCDLKVHCLLHQEPSLSISLMFWKLLWNPFYGSTKTLTRLRECFVGWSSEKPWNNPSSYSILPTMHTSLGLRSFNMPLEDSCKVASVWPLSPVGNIPLDTLWDCFSSNQLILGWCYFKLKPWAVTLTFWHFQHLMQIFSWSL